MAASRSKTSRTHSRYVSSSIGKLEKRDATASRSAARLRCCHSGARTPGRRRGSSSARAAASRNLAANSEVLPSCRSTRSFNSAGAGSSHSVSSGSFAFSGRRITKPSSLHIVSTSTPRSARSFAVDRHAPRRMNAAAERREHADAPVAQLVAAAFDHDVAIARHPAGGRSLVFQVAQQVLGRVGSRLCSSTRRVNAAARGVASSSRVISPISPAELRGPSRAVAVPERHLAGLARRRRHRHAIVRDLVDPPGGGAQDDGVAGAALEDHLFIQLAHARAPRARPPGKRRTGRDPESCRR